jgi:hypothetical protein
MSETQIETMVEITWCRGCGGSGDRRRRICEFCNGSGMFARTIPLVDHRQRATDLHRRAQRAEAALERAERRIMSLERGLIAVIKNRLTVKRKLSRAQARLRAIRFADPLTRIIELGKRFP